MYEEDKLFKSGKTLDYTHWVAGKVRFGAREHMKTTGWGRVVNISSAAVKSSIPHLGLSNGARPGLSGAVVGISRQLAPFGITINYD